MKISWWQSTLARYGAKAGDWYIGEIEEKDVGQGPPDYIYGGLTPRHFHYGEAPWDRAMFVGVVPTGTGKLVTVMGDGSVQMR